jgi:tetratricopeptide (TPR) repeat protein
MLAAEAGRRSSLSEVGVLARSLHAEGRAKDALTLLEHLQGLQPNDGAILRDLVRMLGEQGRPLEAIETLCALKAVTPDVAAILDDIRAQMPAAMERFNTHVAANEIEQAEKYAAAFAALVPGNVALLNSALSCNLALQRPEQAKSYAAAILRLDPAHLAARAAVDAAVPSNVGHCIEDKMKAVLAASDAHPLMRLRDIHDVISLMLCEALSNERVVQIERLMAAARALKVEVPAGSEYEGWEKHYRLALQAIDIDAVIAPIARALREPAIELASSAGKRLTWQSVQAHAKRLKVKAVFFSAADRKYVDLYAGWYIKSILKYADVSSLIVVHVIGGAGQLKVVAKALGISDERLILSGDAFDAAGVTTKCYDTPPKGLITIPVAHFQSVRFLRLGALLDKLKLPVFVSDIDLILQRGVKDLLQRARSTDVMFNENRLNTNAGSRLTANLLLVHPTKNAALFLRFLRAALEKALAGAEVSRWIDQFVLLLARHHLVRHGRAPEIGSFDTDSDINNVMYTSYQAHPFRFLSLYHGFDTSSLERNASVLGKKPARRKRR